MKCHYWWWSLKLLTRRSKRRLVDYYPYDGEVLKKTTFLYRWYTKGICYMKSEVFRNSPTHSESWRIKISQIIEKLHSVEWAWSKYLLQLDIIVQIWNMSSVCVINEIQFTSNYTTPWGWLVLVGGKLYTDIDWNLQLI